MVTIKTSSRRTGRVSLLVRVQALVGIGVILSLTMYVYIILRASRTFSQGSPPLSSPTTTASSVSFTKSLATVNAPAIKEYECSIYYLRMPKTASTTVMHSFIMPIVFKNNLFPGTDNDRNTCIEGVGGCAKFWGDMYKSESVGRTANETSTDGVPSDGVPPMSPPPFGFAHENDESHLRHTNSTNNQRCFQNDVQPLFCYEYDSRISRLDFGAHAGRHNKRKKKRKKPTPPAPTSKQIGLYSISPGLKTHVGLDPSLFGWVLPKNTMVFSTFRDPLDRLLSSFHYGIQIGAGRPGEVQKCDLPGVDRPFHRSNPPEKIWQQIVVDARKIATMTNDTSAYQQLLRKYLDVCRFAADNAYVQFLDPLSKNTTVALANLERYVIVGLQSEIDQTLDRWRNITLRSCTDHPRFKDLKNVTAHALSSGKNDGGYRKSVVEITPDESEDAHKEKNESSVHKEKNESSVQLVSPDVENFEQDLQELIRKFIAGDEVIYKRVVEMYHGSQKDLGHEPAVSVKLN